jgi:hypothetical protein
METKSKDIAYPLYLYFLDSLTKILQRPYKGLFIEVLSQYKNGYRNTNLKKYQVEEKRLRNFFGLNSLMLVLNIFDYGWQLNQSIDR